MSSITLTNRQVFGWTDNLSNKVFLPITYAAAQLTLFPDAAAETAIVSDSVNDFWNSASGARTVCIEGLDDSLEMISEVVNMTALTPVILSNQYRRVTYVGAVTAGVVGTNTGNIEVYHTGTGDILCAIEAGFGNSTQAALTVPRNYSAKVTRLQASVISPGARVECRLIIKGPCEFDAERLSYIWILDANAAQDVNFKFESPIDVPEGHTVWIEGKGSNKNLEISAHFDVTLTRFRSTRCGQEISL